MKIKKIADSFELPKDIVLGIPIVTCYGSDQMTIENHKGILVFNDKYINLLKYEQPSKKDIVTTDYFDYLLMITGSEKSKLMN